MIKLTLTEKGGEPKVLTFDKDEITIGRVSGNDIVLAKGNISKRHTRLTKREGGMEIADLKSTNGTYVNGRKIAGPTAVAPSDRIYVGDFLIGLDGPGAIVAEPGGLHSPASGLHSPASTTSASRRLPVPPPPPPPARGGSSASRLPDEETSTGGEDEEDIELAARPPRAGRPIPPPPPPPPPSARRPTPMASASLGLDDEEEPFADGPPIEMSQPSEDTGNVGLFQHTRRGGDDDADGASRRVGTGNRPGLVAAAAPQAPAFGGATGPVATLGPDASGAGAAPGLETLLADPAVTQILITAPDAALVDRGSGLSLYDGDLGDSNAVADVLWRYANNAYPPPPPDNPVVDVRLPDGTRVSAAFPPAAPGGVVASIRRTVLPEGVMVDLVPGANKDVQALLDAMVATRRNVLVTGDAAALPAALAAFGREVPADRRVVAIGAASRSRSGWIDLAPTADADGAPARGGGAASRSPGRRRPGRPRGRRARAGRDARAERAPARDAGPVAQRGRQPIRRAGRGRPGRDGDGHAAGRERVRPLRSRRGGGRRRAHHRDRRTARQRLRAGPGRCPVPVQRGVEARCGERTTAGTWGLRTARRGARRGGQPAAVRR